MGVKESSEKSLDLFLKIGLDEKTAKNTVANNKVTTNLTDIINLAGVADNGCSKTIGNLLYTVATKYPTNARDNRVILLEYIVSSKIKTPAQVEAAFLFLGRVGNDKFDIKEFEEACGVGVEVSEEEIERSVSQIFEENKNSILEKRYRTNGQGYHKWVRDVCNHLTAQGILAAIQPPNEDVIMRNVQAMAVTNNAKTLIQITRHIVESLEQEYMHEDNARNLWVALEERFETFVIPYFQI